MARIVLLAILLLVGCEDAKDKAKSAARKVDNAVENLDVDEVKQHLQSAKDALARGAEAAEDCSWLERAGSVDNATVKSSLDELRKICGFAQPLARAARAVARAEKAKAEQPEAPSYTECSDDDWARVKAELDASPHASDPQWTDLKTRWSKVCGAR
jgi:hypothetical protein